MRNLSPDIWEDEWFGMQDETCMLLWIGLLTKVCDDQGRFLDNPSLIKSKLFPLKETPTAADISNTIAFFTADEKLISYQAEGKHYLQFANWWKYQASSQWMGASKYPAPEGWQDCFNYHGKGNTLVTSTNWKDRAGGYTKIAANLPTKIVTNLAPVLPYDVKDDVKVKEEEEEEEESEIQKQTALVFTFYENNIEMLTEFNSERLGGLITDYSPAWVLEGLKDCIEYNGKSLKYLESILKGWKAHGFRVDTRKKKGFSAPPPAPVIVPDNPVPVPDTSVPIPAELRAKMNSLFGRPA